MRHTNEFVNKSCLDFIEVGSYDADELAELAPLRFRNVSIELDALKCLVFFPYVENLILRPGEIREENLACLRGLQIKTLNLDYYSDCIDSYSIDISQFPKLQLLFSRTQYNFSNIAKCPSLCTLIVQEWYCDDLTYLRGSHLQALCIFSGRLQHLEGVQSMPNLRSISIANQRRLSDVHCLDSCCGLESLVIEKCNRVPILQLPTLPYLRYLALIGTQKAANLSFLDSYPKLEYLLLGIFIADGNLQALFKLKHCAILTDCRHYSAKNAALPKSPQKFHSASIPHWLEILP